MKFGFGKPKGVDPTKMMIDLRVMEAQARQCFQKAQREIDMTFKLFQNDCRRGDRDSLFHHAHQAAKSKRMYNAYERILGAVRKLKDNAAHFSSQAAAKKPLDPDDIQDIRILCTIPDASKMDSFVKFRAKFLVPMYGKNGVQTMADPSKIDECVRLGLYDDCVEEREITNILMEFVNQNQPMQGDIESLIGYSLSQAQANSTGGFPGMDTSALFLLPFDIPEIPREKWAQLERVISDSVV
ncbi:hypothetical protein GPJ56_008131 [Histomonas meleagridis]|uniref:uncharacterized protein n=1 Tax=Histomonas meleagridis TaxID=135588 RepID=UPI00355A32E6|nr:hypothetical protein GPJ56_008131 [Histomonas meleagridis]KAH0803129.1 hypothetical protein GO595_004222 [Histomonas meleagridis]